MYLDKQQDRKIPMSWKNAIPKEIPAMIPRLASIVLVTRAKQPVVYTSFSALSRSFRVSGEHLVLSLQQLAGMPFSLK